MSTHARWDTVLEPRNSCLISDWLRSAQVRTWYNIGKVVGMPPKIRELKATLAKAGFTMRPAKGSHTYWTHPALLGISITISGKDGNDAKPYQVKDVEKYLRRLKEQSE